MLQREMLVPLADTVYPSPKRLYSLIIKLAAQLFHLISWHSLEIN
jgi:hypothetical protein